MRLIVVTLVALFLASPAISKEYTPRTTFSTYPEVRCEPMSIQFIREGDTWYVIKDEPICWQEFVSYE